LYSDERRVAPIATKFPGHAPQQFEVTLKGRG
jgi:hypothetical protein